MQVGAFLWTYPHLLWENKPQKALKRWPLVVNIFSIFAAKVFEYFPITLHRCVLSKAVIFDPNAQYLFGYHPHGCECFGLFALCFPELSHWNNLFPNLRSAFRPYSHAPQRTCTPACDAHTCIWLLVYVCADIRCLCRTSFVGVANSLLCVPILGTVCASAVCV